jgi:hypothetical protein
MKIKRASSNHRDGLDTIQRESGGLRVLIAVVIALRPDLKARLGLKQASLAASEIEQWPALPKRP